MPRVPAPPPPPSRPPVSEESDDDLTSVMSRAPFEEMDEPPPGRRMPSLHDDDARGETMIMAEAPMRGMVPGAPPNVRRDPRPPPDPFGRGARFEAAPAVTQPHPLGGARPGSPGTFPPPPDRARRNTGDLPRPGAGNARPPSPSVPPLGELVPPPAHHTPPPPGRPRRSTTPPTSGGTVQIARPPPRGPSGPAGFNAAFNVTAPLGHPIMNDPSRGPGPLGGSRDGVQARRRHETGGNPLAPPPQAPPAALPRPDPSLAVARAAMRPAEGGRHPEGASRYPSAPPVLGGRGSSFRPPSDVRPAIGGSGVYSPHISPHVAHARMPTNPPLPPTVRAAPAAAAPLSGAGIVSLVLFALPLALAMFVVAALALL
jgi:hypothetical protein